MCKTEDMMRPKKPAYEELEQMVEELKGKVSKYKETEEALRRSAEHLRVILDTVQANIFYKDNENRFLSANRAWFDTFDLKPEVVIGRKLSEFIPPDTAEALYQDDMEVIRSGQPKLNIEEKIQTNAGMRWFITDKVPYRNVDGKIQGIIGFGRDITERKRAEEMLRERERRFKAIADYTYDWENWVGNDGRLLWVNPVVERMTGFSPQEVLSMADFPLPLVMEEDRPRALIEFQNAVQNRISEGNFEVRFRRKDGQIIWGAVAWQQFFNENGESIGHRSSIRDITERKRAEIELERMRALLSDGQRIAHLGSWEYIADTQETVWSEEEFRIYGLDPARQPPTYQTLLRKNIHPDDAVMLDQTFRKALRDGSVFELEHRIVRKNGDERVLHNLAHPYFDEKGKLVKYVGATLDITDRKQAEEQMFSLQEQLQQSQKMEAIGRLAGGVAHDFNNLLTVISIQSQLSLLGLREGDPLREKLQEIEKAADRAANLTRQLLAFSRRQLLEMKVLNLNFIVSDLEKMLHRVIGEHIELKTILADDLGMVKVDPGQMEQVILNLVVNAKDAMPQGGQLILETANAELDEQYTSSNAGMVPGPYIMFSITDTGTGMTKEVREQIFEPFFTSKEKGKGTGLGLSTVHGIVKQSGGDIYVYSEPDKGTSFKIYLPRVYEAPEEVKKATLEETPRGKETILVVEDEDAVRKLVVDILRVQGYLMLKAREGREALVLCEKEKGPIDLILTDIVMPCMGGPELIERCKQVRTDFKILYMTGHTDDAIVEHGVVDKTINLIPKPFAIEKLARMVREVLDKN